MNIKSEITVQQAIADANFLLSGNLRNKINDGEDGWSYYKMSKPLLFSNENTLFLKKVIPKKEKVTAYTVAGSFDQIIDLALNGVSVIYGVDINRLQFYIGVLKLVCLKNMKYRLFKRVLCNAQSEDCFSHKELLRAFEVEGNENKTIQAVGYFWKILFSRKNYLDIRKEFILSEESFIKNGSNRILNFEYLRDKRAFEKAKRAIEKTEIFLKEGDFFEEAAELAKRDQFDIVLASNLFNFAAPDFFHTKIEEIYQLITEKGKLIHYAIQVPIQWFYDFVRWDGLLAIHPWEFQLEYINEISTMLSLTQQLFLESLKKYQVELYGVATGKGYSFALNTDSDTVICITKE